MSNKLSLPGLTKVEQTSVQNFISEALNKKKTIQATKQNAQTLMNDYDEKEFIKAHTHKKMLIQNSNYLQSQIDQKRQKQLSASELSKLQFKEEFEATPENQVCAFPKITEETPYERTLEKLRKQQELSNALNEQINLKTLMELNTSYKEKNELEKEIKQKEIYDKEVNDKKVLIKEYQKKYKEELDKLVSHHKLKKEEALAPQFTSLKVGEREMNSPENANENFDESIDANKSCIQKQNYESAFKRSISVDNDIPICSDYNEYSKKLVQKVDDYQTRITSKKSYYNIEKLRALLLKSNGFGQPKTIRPFFKAR
jgi:hypothetical protein